VTCAAAALIVPITVLLIVLLLYTAFGSFNWSLLIMATLATAPIGGMLALLVTGTHFSVSSGIGMLALFGVSVQVGLIMIQYINQARVDEPDIMKATVEGAVRSLRPTLMVMLVATLGLLPAALSHGIGSDSQRPFAIVIVGGLTTDLFLSVILLPTLYALIARPGDKISDK
jgi:cobalt-zinc-cadmium resistance protein CzcA